MTKMEVKSITKTVNSVKMNMVIYGMSPRIAECMFYIL